MLGKMGKIINVRIVLRISLAVLWLMGDLLSQVNTTKKTHNILIMH
jgi:hypothetical protein